MADIHLQKISKVNKQVEKSKVPFNILEVIKFQTDNILKFSDVINKHK